MANVAQIPITNVYEDGDYTGRISVGPDLKPMNVILDTGSSALALDGKKYQPDFPGGDKSTNLAQTDSYGDGSSFTGAVIETQVCVGEADSSVKMQGANVAVAYTASDDMFGNSDGILGLAYAALDDAFTMPGDTWANKYTAVQVRTGGQAPIQPYLTQLAGAGVVSDKISFLTRRSQVHVGGGDPLEDPLNQGVMVVGGGEEFTNLYTGSFQTVKVLSDDWYSTNLKAVIVGNSDPIAARLQGPQGMPSNSIIDSGTNSLCLGVQMIQAIISKLPPALQPLMQQGAFGTDLTAVASLNLAQWPTLTFILQGDSADVTLQVVPTDYWQVNTQSVGYAQLAITKNSDTSAILGLPIMNGYFTIFDGEADGGKGVVKFATRTA